MNFEVNKSLSESFINRKVDLRDYADPDENIAKIIDIKDLWSRSINGSLINFAEDFIIKNSRFFEECVFLSCVFKKNVIIRDSDFRKSLAFNSCLFLGEFTIMDSSFNSAQFSDNVFKSDVIFLRNTYLKGNNILTDKHRPDGNKFDRQPIFQNNTTC